MSHFADRLTAAVVRCRTPVMVGLDPRAESLPRGLLAEDRQHDPTAVADAFARFSCGVIDAVRDLVPVVKPQAAFFEECGPAGVAA